MRESAGSRADGKSWPQRNKPEATALGGLIEAAWSAQLS
jgi:hypothetical protein